MGYEALIQPILNERCVSCHGRDDPDGGLELSDTPTGDGFYQSFATLFGRRADGQMAEPWISVANRLSDSSVTQPFEFGSHRSRLIGVLRNDPLHQAEAQLSPQQWKTLVTWIDAHAPYHDRRHLLSGKLNASIGLRVRASSNSRRARATICGC